MRKIARFIAPALVATLGLSAIAPTIAEAAPRHDVRHGPNREAKVRSDISSLRAKIDRAAARRTISQREAASLRKDTAEIQRLYGTYSRGGLNAREIQTLESRINRVEAALRADHRGPRR